MLIIIRKNSQYIGLLILISFTISFITPGSAKSLPHNKSHNSRNLNAKLQALVSHTNEQLLHQKTGDLRQLLTKSATSGATNMQQPAATTRPYLNNIEYDLRLRQLMEELVSHSRIQNPHYAVHTLLPMELQGSYQQHLEDMAATATAPVSTADKPNFTHNNKIIRTTSNEGENYQQQQHQYQKDNKDFVNTSSLFTPANVLLHLNKRNTTLTKDTTDTTKLSPPSSSSSSSSSSSLSLTSSAGPPLSIASLKDSLLDYVLLEYMTKSKQNLTKILDTNRVEGNSLAALPNAQRIRQQLEFLQKNAKKFKKFQQVEERTKNASAVSEFDVIKNINALQEGATKEQHWLDVWKEISNVDKEYQIKSKNSVNKSNTSSNILTQLNVTRLPDFFTHAKQNETDVKVLENLEKMINPSAFKTDTDTNSNTHDQILENFAIIKKDLQLLQSYNNSLPGNDLSLSKSNESLDLLETISKNGDINSSTLTPINDIRPMPKKPLAEFGQKTDNVFQQNFETTTRLEFPEVMENVKTVKKCINKSEDITMENIYDQTGTETGTDNKIPVLSTTANYDNETGLEQIENEIRENIYPGKSTAPKASGYIQYASEGFQVEDTATTNKSEMENKSLGSTSEERQEDLAANLAVEETNLRNNPTLIQKHIEQSPSISRYEETKLTQNELLPASQAITTQNPDVNNLGNKMQSTKQDTTAEQKLLLFKTSDIATKAPGYQHQSFGITSEMPHLPTVTTPTNSVDNQLPTTNVIHEINTSTESTQVPNTSNYDMKLSATALESNNLTALAGRVPDSNIIIPNIFDHQINIGESYDRHSSSNDTKLSTELPSSNKFMGLPMEALKNLPSSWILNSLNTTILTSNISNTENELATQLPRTTTKIPISTGNFADSTTSFLAITEEEEISTVLPVAVTGNFWSSVVPSFTEEPYELQANLRDTETGVSNLEYDNTSEIYDEVTSRLPISGTSHMPDLKRDVVSLESPPTDLVLSSGELTTLSSQYETTSITLLNGASDFKKELPITDISLEFKDITGSTKYYDAKLNPTLNKINELSTELSISEAIPDFPQIPVITELPITDPYLTRDATTVSLQDITEVLPLSTQIQTEQTHINIETATKFPLTDSHFPEEESTKTPKTATEVIIALIQDSAEGSITKGHIPTELPFNGISYIRGNSADSLKAAKEMISNSTQFPGEETTIASDIAIKLPTNDTNFAAKYTTNATLTQATEEPKYKTKIRVEFPIDDTYLTREMSMGTSTTEANVIPFSTEIQSEEPILELPTKRSKFSGEETTFKSKQTTKEKPWSAKISNKMSLSEPKTTTELPTTGFDSIREDTPYNPNEEMPASTQIPSKVSNTPNESVTDLPTTNANDTEEEQRFKFTLRTEMKPSSAQILTKESFSKLEITTELPINDLNSIREDTRHNPNEIMPAPAQIQIEVTTADGILATELPTTDTNFHIEQTKFTAAIRTTVKPPFSQILTKESFSKPDIATEFPITDFDFTSEDSSYNPIKDVPSPTPFPTEVSIADNILITELPTTDTDFEGKEAKDTPITTTKVMPHITTTQIPEQDLNIETDITNELLTTQNYLKHPKSSNIPEPSMASTVITNFTVVSLSRNKNEFTTELPTSKPNLVAAKITSPIRIGDEETTDITKTPSQIDEIISLPENPIVIETNRDKLSVLPELTDKLPTELPIKHILLNTSLKTRPHTAELVIVNDTEDKSDYHPASKFALPIPQGLVSHKVYATNYTVTIPVKSATIQEYNTDNRKSNKEQPSVLIITKNVTEPGVESPANLNHTLKSIIDKSSKETNDTSQANNQSLNQLDDDFVFQFTLNNKTSHTDNIKVQPEKLKSGQAAVATLAINSATSQTDNLVPDRLLASELPIVNLITNHSTIAASTTKSESSQSGNLFVDRLLVPELPTGNLQSVQSSVSGNDVKSEASQSDNRTPDRRLDPELPIQNLPTAQSSVTASAYQSATSQSGILIANTVLLPESPPGNLKSEQSAVPSNDVKSEIIQSSNLIPNGQLEPELPTKNLKIDHLAVSKNSSKSGTSQSDTLISDQLQVVQLPIKKSATKHSVVSPNANNLEISQSVNIIADRLLVAELPNGTLGSGQSVVTTNDINSDSSQSDNIIAERLLVPESLTENLQNEQPTISINPFKSEALQIDNLIPELPIQNLTAAQSAVASSTTKSETLLRDNIIANMLILVPELPTVNLKNEQSTISTNANKSVTSQTNNIFPNGTANLKIKQSAVSTNTDFEEPNDSENYEILHTFQPEMGSLETNLNETENVSYMEHKPSKVIEHNYESSSIPAVVKQDLNLPDVEVVLQGITSHEVNSIKYDIEDSHIKRKVGKKNSTESESIESTTGAVKSQDSDSVSNSPLIAEIYKLILTKNKVIQSKLNENAFKVAKPIASKPEEEIEQNQQSELNVADFYHNKPINEIIWILYSPSRIPSIIHEKLTEPYETSVTQAVSTSAEQLPNATKLEIVKPQEAPESRLDELITIIGNSLQGTSGSNTKSQHVASGVTHQCPDNNNKQQQPSEKEQQHQHQGPKIHDDGTASLVNCSSATQQTMQLTALPSTALSAAATLALRTTAHNELENVQMMAISKTIENQKDNKGKWTTFKNNHLNNGSLPKAGDNGDVPIPEIQKDNANDHSHDENEDEHDDTKEDDEGVHEVAAANKSSINDKDIRLETKVRPSNVMATEINASYNTPAEAEQHHDDHVLDRTNNAQDTNSAFKIPTATKSMAGIEDKSVVEAGGGLNEMSTIETKLFDISKDNRKDMTITGLKTDEHNANPTLYEVVNDDVTTMGLKKDSTQKGNEHDMTLLESHHENVTHTQGTNKDAVNETDDYEIGDHQYVITFPSSYNSDETDQDEIIAANVKALDAVAQEVEQLPTLTDTFLNTQSFPDVTPYHSNLHYKSYRSRKKQQKLKHIHASVNPHPKEEITTTNWWHSLPYAEIRKFLSSISDSVEGW